MTNPSPPPEAQDSAAFGFEDVPRAEKASRVRAVFDSVADRYDLMNDLMSAGLHRLWKDAAADRLNPQPGETILDIAGGTGDIARRLWKRAEKARSRRGGDPARIIISDINADMLAAGERKSEALGEDHFEWVCGDGENLPFPDHFADAYTISFGIRNFTNIDAALRDARRVLKPGGRFLCLEFSKLAIGALEPIYDAYSFHVIPRIGQITTNDADSYRYLVESIRRFPDQETFADMIRAAGFKRVSYSNFTGGVAALHTGWAL